jgi:hypothetical protein
MNVTNAGGTNVSGTDVPGADMAGTDVTGMDSNTAGVVGGDDVTRLGGVTEADGAGTADNGSADADGLGV